MQENGTVTPSIQVAVDPGRLSASGFTLTDVVSTITNNNVRAPGGILYSPNRETNLDVRGDIQDAAERRRTSCSAGGGGAATRTTNAWSTQARLFRIGDVANVTDTYETQRVFAYSTACRASTLDIQKSAEHERGRDLASRAGGAARAAPHVSRRAVHDSQRPVDLHRSSS